MANEARAVMDDIGDCARFVMSRDNGWPPHLMYEVASRPQFWDHARVRDARRILDRSGHALLRRLATNEGITHPDDQNIGDFRKPGQPVGAERAAQIWGSFIEMLGIAPVVRCSSCQMTMTVLSDSLRTLDDEDNTILCVECAEAFDDG